VTPEKKKNKLKKMFKRKIKLMHQKMKKKMLLNLHTGESFPNLSVK